VCCRVRHCAKRPFSSTLQTTHHTTLFMSYTVDEVQPKSESSIEFTIYSNRTEDALTTSVFTSIFCPLNVVVGHVLTKRAEYFSGTIVGVAMLQLHRTTATGTKANNTYFWRLNAPLLTSHPTQSGAPPHVVNVEAFVPLQPIVSHDVTNGWACTHRRKPGAAETSGKDAPASRYEVFAIFSSVPYTLFRSVLCDKIDLEHPCGELADFPQYQGKCCAFAGYELATVEAGKTINYFDGCAFTKRGAVGMSLRRGHAKTTDVERQVYVTELDNWPRKSKKFISLGNEEYVDVIDKAEAKRSKRVVDIAYPVEDEPPFFSKQCFSSVKYASDFYSNPVINRLLGARTATR
jgi:hypothetical protein